MDNTQQDERYLSRRAQAIRYEVCQRTIKRWGEDSRLGFPPELDINGRKLRPLSALQKWERERAAVAAAYRAELQKHHVDGTEACMKDGA
jgi:hypothetical protein